MKSQCLSCADGHYLESGTCRLNCSLRTYPADDGTCRRCPLHCDVCSDERTCFSELLAVWAAKLAVDSILKGIIRYCNTSWNFLLQLYRPLSISFQNAVSSTWCWTVCVRLVVPWAIMRTWRRAAVVSATLPVSAVQGPWQMTVKPARHLALNSIRVHAPKTALPVPTMKLKLRSVKVSLTISRYDLITFLSSTGYAG